MADTNAAISEHVHVRYRDEATLYTAADRRVQSRVLDQIQKPRFLHRHRILGVRALLLHCRARPRALKVRSDRCIGLRDRNASHIFLPRTVATRTHQYRSSETRRCGRRTAPAFRVPVRYDPSLRIEDVRLEATREDLPAAPLSDLWIGLRLGFCDCSSRRTNRTSARPDRELHELQVRLQTVQPYSKSVLPLLPGTVHHIAGTPGSKTARRWDHEFER